MFSRLRIPIVLKWKFLIGIISLVLLFGGIHLYLVKIFLGRNLQDELIVRLKTIASSVANTAVPLLLVDDQVGLHKLLLKTKEVEPRISYVLIIRQDGIPDVHTFGSKGIPAGILEANSLGPQLKEHYARIQDVHRRSRTFLDVAYPLGQGGKFGTLRVGMDERELRDTLNHIVTSFLLMIFLFMCVGIAGAFTLSWLINHPIRKIQSALHNFDLSSPVPTIEVSTGDELESFARHTETMLQRLKATHEQLDLLRTKMVRAERVAIIGTMASGIAHEIRNPLAGMLNCLKRLSKNPDPETIHRYLPLMENAARHIEETTSRFLNFGRMTVKEDRKFSVNEAVEKALSLVRPRLDGMAVDVGLSLGKDLPETKGDQSLLEQVLLNLLINALDAIEQNGKICLKTFSNNDHLVVEVQDNGIGIHEESLSHLFDPFYTTKMGEGTGLGLAISSEIIKLFSGRINVSSVPGQGTTFRIEIPLGRG